KIEVSPENPSADTANTCWRVGCSADTVGTVWSELNGSEGTPQIGGATYASTTRAPRETAITSFLTPVSVFNIATGNPCTAPGSSPSDCAGVGVTCFLQRINDLCG